MRLRLQGNVPILLVFVGRSVGAEAHLHEVIVGETL